MHDEAMRWVVDQVAEFGLSECDVLDLGGRDVNGTPRHLFTGRYVVVDMTEAPNVDIVADAAEVNLDERFGCVISTELLEHTPSGRQVVRNAHDHLVPGGVFVATMAGPGRAPHGAHGGHVPPPGEWYENVTPEQLDGWLSAAGFAVWQVDQTGLDVRCWARRGDG